VPLAWLRRLPLLAAACSALACLVAGCAVGPAALRLWHQPAVRAISLRL
jgi:hypothetical protein